MSRAAIPRFLLPLQSPLWKGLRVPASPAVRVRYLSSTPVLSASSSSSTTHKTIVLEKPERFNPPSHGSRLKRGSTAPRHYGPELTADERTAQNAKQYPGLMSPEGTWSHWFWHSRLLHTFITMGTLLGLGIFTFFLNYAHNSPFKDLVPPISDMWHNPTYFFVAWKNVIAMHERDKGARASEHRAAHLDDVAKRRYFMKMHGIEPKDPVAMVFGKGEGPSEEQLEAAAMGNKVEDGANAAEGQGTEGKPRKKWLGIF